MNYKKSTYDDVFFLRRLGVAGDLFNDIFLTPLGRNTVHPLIKVMLVGGKADGLLVSVADTATEVSVTPAQYGAPSGLPLNYRVVSQGY